MSDHRREPSTRDLTRILADLRMGDREAERLLLERVYDELRNLADRMMARERVNHTLQATALVHEAYVRLLGREAASWDNRAHFFGAAARAMRQILVDHARRVESAKRGDRRKRIELGDLQLEVTADAGEVLAIDQALRALEREDQRKARVVELRFFGGLDLNETAEVLDVSPRTVKRDWSFARAWLARWLLRNRESDIGDGQ